MVFGNPDITRMIDRLIAKHFVKRASNQSDKRKIDVSLTDRGVEMLKDLNPKMESTIRGFFIMDVTKEEARSTNEILERIKHVLNGSEG